MRKRGMEGRIVRFEDWIMRNHDMGKRARQNLYINIEKQIFIVSHLGLLLIPIPIPSTFTYILTQTILTI
jgi:hypothetical protein